VATGSRVRIDASEFSRLLNETQSIDKEFALQLLREIRAAAKPLKSKMQRAVRDKTSKRSAKIKGSKIRTRTVKSVDFDGTVIKEREKYTVDTVTNTADLVAQGISFRMNKGKSGASATFRSSSAKLPEGRKAMSRALNKPKFRHPKVGTTTEPVKGGRPGQRKPRPRGQWQWEEQEGRPYFGAVILDDAELIEKAILRAMDQATDRIARSRIR